MNCLLAQCSTKEKHIAITFTLHNHKWNRIWMLLKAKMKRRWRWAMAKYVWYKATHVFERLYVCYGTISLLYFFPLWFVQLFRWWSFHENPLEVHHDDKCLQQQHFDFFKWNKLFACVIWVRTHYRARRECAEEQRGKAHRINVNWLFFCYLYRVPVMMTTTMTTSTVCCWHWRYKREWSVYDTKSFRHVRDACSSIPYKDHVK